MDVGFHYGTISLHFAAPLHSLLAGITHQHSVDFLNRLLEYPRYILCMYGIGWGFVKGPMVEELAVADRIVKMNGHVGLAVPIICLMIRAWKIWSLVMSGALV